MDKNQQQNPQFNQELPKTTTQPVATPKVKQTTPAEPPQQATQTPAQLVDIPEHSKTPPAKKILIISFGFLFLSVLIVGGYYLYTLLVAD